MIRDDDQDWLDALAGRKTAAGETDAAREATLLRGALKADAPEPMAVAQEDRHRETALVELARQRGLLVPKPVRDAARRPEWREHRFAFPAALAFAAIAGLAIGLTLLMRPVAETEIVRGGPSGVVRIVVDSPQQTQQTLLKQLDAAGVKAAAYTQFGRYGIDMELRQPLDAQVADVLRRYHIAPPRGHDLRVEFEAASGR